ncbi:MAG: hypothetical protein ABIF10_02265 [Candidatus Woesearchaeota archaeon]
MLPEVKEDILAVLKQAKECVLQRDAARLSELSNHTIHNASIFQDEDSVSIAVVAYALSKVLQREQGALAKGIVDGLGMAIDSLTKNDFGSYNKSIHSITATISGIDSKMKLYIQQVIGQSQIKKGSKIYDHGISLARASEMLGISQWELMNYVGKTRIIDRSEKVEAAKKRLVFARGLFGI